MEALGATTRWIRAYQGLSQEELGFRAVMHRNYIGALERGELNPTFRTLRKLASGLELPLSELLGRAEQREQETAEREAGTLRLPSDGPDVAVE